MGGCRGFSGAACWRGDSCGFVYVLASWVLHRSFQKINVYVVVLTCSLSVPGLQRLQVAGCEAARALFAQVR